MNSPEKVITQHALNRYQGRAWWCRCGDDALTVEGSHSKHVLDKLDEAGYLITAKVAEI